MHKLLLKVGVSTCAIVFSAGLGTADVVSPAADTDSLLVPVVDQETDSVRKNLRPEIYGSGPDDSEPGSPAQYDNDDDDDDDDGPDIEDVFDIIDGQSD